MSSWNRSRRQRRRHLGLEPLEDRTAPAVFTVSDETSLRSALLAVNALGGSHTVNLPAATITLTLGQLDIKGTTAPVNLTIAGAGSSSTIIDAQDRSRVFQVFADNAAKITGVTLQ